MSSWNAGVIEEFRASGGKVGGVHEGAPLLLLHHTGAKTGVERVTPVMYQAVGTSFAIFASKGGADHHPAWFHNLNANPETKVEVGDQMISVGARVLEGDEREEIWEAQKRDWPQFAQYERKTARKEIPVILLERI